MGTFISGCVFGNINDIVIIKNTSVREIHPCALAAYRSLCVGEGHEQILTTVTAVNRDSPTHHIDR